MKIKRVVLAIRQAQGTDALTLAKKAKEALVKRIDHYLEWGEPIERGNFG